jgi:aspartate kinase
MIVLKFGGTSVEDENAIERAAGIVAGRLHEEPVVVVSALAGVTDSLLAMARAAAAGKINSAIKQWRALRRRHLNVLSALGAASDSIGDDLHALLDSVHDMLRGVAALGELTPRTTDYIVGAGELLSSYIVSAAFVVRGIDAARIDSRECIVTDDNHTSAAPIFDLTDDLLRQRLQPLLAAGKVPVLGGFLGATTKGVPTTLGRGGSDFSASIISAALNAKRIEIWTDVAGMMTTDPRLCPAARRIDVISFEEASELAYFGAKVLHPATLIPAVGKNIPVYVLNSRSPESKGTCIRARAPRSRTTFRAIAAKTGVRVVNVKSLRRLGAHGFLRTIFEALERYACTADLVSTSEVSVSIAINSARVLEGLLRELAALGEVDVEEGKAIICLVGKDISGRLGIAASVFETIAAAGINVHMISQGASEINIGFVIEERDVPEAICHLHRRFFESKSPGSNPSRAVSLPRIRSGAHAIVAEVC